MTTEAPPADQPAALDRAILAWHNAQANAAWRSARTLTAYLAICDIHEAAGLPIHLGRGGRWERRE